MANDYILDKAQEDNEKLDVEFWAKLAEKEEDYDPMDKIQEDERQRESDGERIQTQLEARYMSYD